MTAFESALRALREAATPGGWTADVGQGMALLVGLVRGGRPGGETIAIASPYPGRVRADPAEDAANIRYIAFLSPERAALIEALAAAARIDLWANEWETFEADNGERAIRRRPLWTALRALDASVEGP